MLCVVFIIFHYMHHCKKYLNYAKFQMDVSHPLYL